ncbi:hypothetical protein D3C72_2250320 [compost metagenome]
MIQYRQLLADLLQITEDFFHVLPIFPPEGGDQTETVFNFIQPAGVKLHPLPVIPELERRILQLIEGALHLLQHGTKPSGIKLHNVL